MTEAPVYLSGLVVASLVAFVTGWRFKPHRWQLWRVAGAIFLNWLLGTAYVLKTGDYTPWMFSIVLDAITAAAVMWHPAGRTQVYIGLFYALQIAGHIGYGGRRLFGMEASALFYYDALTWIAWAQLLAIGVWAGGLWVRDTLHRSRPVRHALDRTARMGHPPK
jgi:hypothetical protein